jgi:hypothetical protein
MPGACGAQRMRAACNHSLRDSIWVDVVGVWFRTGGIAGT